MWLFEKPLMGRKVHNVAGRCLLPKSPESFTYDDDGNLLSDGRWIYSWDGQNRLITEENYR